MKRVPNCDFYTFLFETVQGSTDQSLIGWSSRGFSSSVEDRIYSEKWTLYNVVVVAALKIMCFLDPNMKDMIEGTHGILKDDRRVKIREITT